MFTPVPLFSFAGIVIGIGILLTMLAIMGRLADQNGAWFKCVQN